ncbi:MAG: transcription-repair coupling factor [Candidatus Eremiobacteraeota bacterium]|nr:transcription-repair coupling factor [Candidatus Eremiobacteraeota bacterium]
MVHSSDFNDIRALQAFRSLGSSIEKGTSCAVSGIVPPAKPLFMALLLAELPLPSYLVTSDSEKAERFYHALHFFTPPAMAGRIALMPEINDDEGEDLSGGATALWLPVLEKLSQREEIFLITPLSALLKKIETMENLRQGALSVVKNQVISPSRLCEHLVERGYERSALVEKRGEFSLRGCILDMYPATGVPVRLEFWGDEVESIRGIDVATQRSAGEAPSVRILSLSGTRESSTLLDYLPLSSWLILDEPSQLALQAYEHGETPAEAADTSFKDRKLISLSSWGHEEEIHFATATLSPFYRKLEDFSLFLREKRAQGHQVIVISTQDARLRDVLAQEGIAAADEAEPGAGFVSLVHGSLDEGFFFEPGWTVLTDREILGTKRSAHFIAAEKRYIPVKLEDLTPGDFVVHVLHGIGVYRGLRTLTIKDHAKEFLALEYAKGDMLFVPVDQMEQIHRFTGLEEKTPSLSYLGGKEWKNTRAKIRHEVEEIAKKLVELYARRDALEGFAFSPDMPWQGELESSFPYEETPDQLKAVEEVKHDMEKIRPMDRLICGDAGYGKTEVALRSAFKAVMDGKQVALLVPTTILADQHYTTFSERLAPFPMKVEMLSRFRSAGEQKAIIDSLREGSLDIIIGTHRLLSEDVQFKSLGLVIIDEEQHFGVLHKERLKELRSHVDVITLSATPIPRTLSFALSGIRDMSLITTPPENRLPVKTFLLPFRHEVIKGAVSREIERGGQVYFIHNRIRGIAQMASAIEKLVPGARVATAHGQMSEEDLERIMKGFLDRACDVLVCTTIIESGIDISNVNTIIINNAYGFGLAQLYQLRGRVGRSHRQAYAYLLYPAHRKLGDMARKRMETLKDFSDLGAGFHIAMRDLELRGAGNILGTEQHGFVRAVGFDLYCRLLDDAVKELKGEKPRKEEGGPSIELPLSAYLPGDYVPDDRQKITLYRRMSALTTAEEAASIEEELRDRFGPLPPEARNMLALLVVKSLLISMRIPKISHEGCDVFMLMPFFEGFSAEALRALRATGTAMELRNNRLTLVGLLDKEEWTAKLIRFLAAFRKAAGSSPSLPS